MLARLFFNISRLVWLPDTVYHWIKRDGSLSVTTYTPEHYADYFQCCDIFYEEAAKRRQLRLADAFCDTYLSCYLTHLLQQAIAGKSREGGVREVIATMAGLCERHDVFSRCLPELRKNPLRRAGLYRLRHILRDTSPSATQRLVTAHNKAAGLVREAEYGLIRKHGWKNEISFDKFDAEQGLLRARYLFCDRPPEEEFLCGGVPLAPAFAKNRSVFDGKGYAIFERILWLPVPEDARGDLNLRVGGKDAGPGRGPADIRASFRPAPLNDGVFPPEARALRRLVRSEAVRERFKDAWMFIDRDNRADDNAEHLCRWVMRNRPEINAWFVLREDSPDWPRLKAGGFRLVPFGGMEHDALFLLAKNLISSQMDQYIYARLDGKYYSDLRHCKFVSLQHGVINDDLSPWLNPVDMDCFVTSTRDEWRSIVGDGAPYLLTEKEVVRTGLARHDSLLNAPAPERRILVMPTWRANLVGAWDGKGQRRDYNPAFAASSFVRTWRAFLASPELAGLCRKHGCEIVFRPHPGFSDYLEEFALPAHIRASAEESIQALLKSSALLITDYSSIAFDMAVLRRPVLYWHFEDRARFAAGQNRKSGHFSHERDGFGPVCRTKGELLEHLGKILESGREPAREYLERMEHALDLTDGKCRERTVEAIMRLDAGNENAGTR